jgi:hypothetical protein
VELVGAQICGGDGATDPVEEKVVKLRSLCVGGLVSSASIGKIQRMEVAKTHTSI